MGLKCKRVYKMYSKIYIGKKQIEFLIKEVKSRPALYDSSAKGYTDRRYKTLLWNEISTKLGYPGNSLLLIYFL